MSPEAKDTARHLQPLIPSAVRPLCSQSVAAASSSDPPTHTSHLEVRVTCCLWGPHLDLKACSLVFNEALNSPAPVCTLERELNSRKGGYIPTKALSNLKAPPCYTRTLIHISKGISCMEQVPPQI